MLSNMKDEHIRTLLHVAKTNKALRPFFGTPHGMIALREEASRRGIYRTECEANRIMRDVFREIEEEPQPTFQRRDELVKRRR